MTDQEAIQIIIKNLDDAIAAQKNKQSTQSACIGDCDSSYNKCMASAGSDMEKTVCKSAYNKCIANC